MSDTWSACFHVASMSLSIYLEAINQQLIAAHHTTHRGNYLFKFSSWPLQMPPAKSLDRQALLRVGTRTATRRVRERTQGSFHGHQALISLGCPATPKAVLRASLPGHPTAEENRINLVKSWGHQVPSTPHTSYRLHFSPSHRLSKFPEGPPAPTGL